VEAAFQAWMRKPSRSASRPYHVGSRATSGDIYAVMPSRRAMLIIRLKQAQPPQHKLFHLPMVGNAYLRPLCKGRALQGGHSHQYGGFDLVHLMSATMFLRYL
jgi:hypothetical protein